MNDTIKIALLHLSLLATQGIHIYVSNKQQYKNKRHLFLLAIPLVAVLPVFLSKQSLHSYSIYEYSIVLCIMIAAIADTSYTALTNKEYFTDATIRRLHYSYFLICLMAAFSGEISIWVKAVCMILLAGVLCWSCLIKKHSYIELIKAIPLAFFSYTCAWTFVKYVIKV